MEVSTSARGMLPHHHRDAHHQDMREARPVQYTAMAAWLRKHGKAPVRPRLTDAQKVQLAECFELMDQDGSGAIDKDELGAAFRLLGFNLPASGVLALLQEVDHDHSGAVEYGEFLEIMVEVFQRRAEAQQDEGNTQHAEVPYALMVTAYRRKRMMEGLIRGDTDMTEKIDDMGRRAEKAKQQAILVTPAKPVRASSARPSSSASPRGQPPTPRSSSSSKTSPVPVSSSRHPPNIPPLSFSALLKSHSSRVAPTVSSPSPLPVQPNTSPARMRSHSPPGETPSLQEEDSTLQIYNDRSSDSGDDRTGARLPTDPHPRTGSSARRTGLPCWESRPEMDRASSRRHSAQQHSRQPSPNLERERGLSFRTRRDEPSGRSRVVRNLTHTLSLNDDRESPGRVGPRQGSLQRGHSAAPATSATSAPGGRVSSPPAATTPRPGSTATSLPPQACASAQQAHRELAQEQQQQQPLLERTSPCSGGGGGSSRLSTGRDEQRGRSARQSHAQPAEDSAAPGAAGVHGPSHYSQTAKHRDLMHMPQPFQVMFESRPLIKLPAGAQALRAGVTGLSQPQAPCPHSGPQETQATAQRSPRAAYTMTREVGWSHTVRSTSARAAAGGPSASQPDPTGKPEAQEQAERPPPANPQASTASPLYRLDLTPGGACDTLAPAVQQRPRHTSATAALSRCAVGEKRLRGRPQTAGAGSARGSSTPGWDSHVPPAAVVTGLPHSRPGSARPVTEPRSYSAWPSSTAVNSSSAESGLYPQTSR
ncbi:MAG: hypothetical protein WDW38_003882 [Sanguina aurantia]